MYFFLEFHARIDALSDPSLSFGGVLLMVRPELKLVKNHQDETLEKVKILVKTVSTHFQKQICFDFDDEFFIMKCLSAIV